MKAFFGIEKIVSGGQTGADRAAFDFALANGIGTGGFIPKGRIAEDGLIPFHYLNLTETDSADLAVRTELNALHSDATLIFSHGRLTGGSLLTRQLVEKNSKPFLHIDLNIEHTDSVAEWLASHPITILNIAGSRASEDRLIYTHTKAFLLKLSDWSTDSLR